MKVTLVTPPDFYENYNPSLLLINITEYEQEQASSWLANCDIDQQINLYFYQGENHVPWLMHALNCSSKVYINLESLSGATTLIAGYILGKNSVYYTADDADYEIYNHINQRRVTSIEQFFESALGVKSDGTTL